MISVIPIEGVPVRDPRLTPIHDRAFVYLTGPVELPETDPAGLQLLRHVRRGELNAGNQQTAALAGIQWKPAVAPMKGDIK